MNFKGLLFDLDGTLIDSLAIVDLAWRQFARRNHLDEETTMDFIHGRPALQSVRQLLPDLSEAKQQHEFNLLNEFETNNTDGIVVLKGTRELLAQLEARDIPWAIVTSGTKAVAYARVQACQLPMPKVFITADHINNGKPDPEPYLLGASKLGLKPSDCIVFEDAPAGVNSGVNAGCRVIAIDSHYTKQQLAAADIFVGSLAQVSLSAGALSLNIDA